MKSRLQTTFLSAPVLALLLLSDSSLSMASTPPTGQQTTPENASSGAESRKESSSNNNKTDIPKFDPDGEIVTWNGQIWNIHNNRLIRARLEKYLNEPPQTEEQDAAYRRCIQNILQKLSPENYSKKNENEAWQLLFRAAEYPADANISASIAEAVYAIILSKSETESIERANVALRKEQESLNSNMAMEASSESLGLKAPKDPNEARIWNEQMQQKRQILLSPYVKRMEELDLKYKANQIKTEGAKLESKIQYQALVVQLFTLRRFEHVLIATRFYRSLYGDGDNKLNLGDDVKGLFNKGSGVPPTLSVIDTLANEAIHDVEKGVQAYLFLMEKQEIDSAIKRLTEAYAVGEHLPVVQTLSREQKRLGLTYLQKSNALLAALEVKDYSEAERLLNELKSSTKDFVPTKPLAAIKTATTMSDMHLAKAQAAAASGNKETFESELKEAAEMWPGNPKLAKLSDAIFGQVNEQQKALAELDRLISQKSYRQIFDEKVKYIAASAMLPEKQKELTDILAKMQRVEIALAQAQEIAKRGDHAGAWEGIETVYREFPEDNKLNQTRAEYTVKASDFVKSLQNAKALEEKKEFGSSLAWYLKARSYYPPSQISKEGIDRIVKEQFTEEPVTPKQTGEAKALDSNQGESSKAGLY